MSENLLGRKINWAPDGKSLLVLGAKPRRQPRSGWCEYTTEKPFSAKPEDWDNRGFVTDVVQAGQGRARRGDLARRQAARRVVPTKGRAEPAGDQARTTTLLADAKELNVRACKAIWRPDGQELVVVRADDCLGLGTGELVRVPRREPEGPDGRSG